MYKYVSSQVTNLHNKHKQQTYFRNVILNGIEIATQQNSSARGQHVMT